MSDEPEEKSNPARWSTGPDGVRPIGKTVRSIDYTKPSQQLQNAENEKALEEARKTK